MLEEEEKKNLNHVRNKEKRKKKVFKICDNVFLYLQIIIRSFFKWNFIRVYNCQFK